jgi:hypothetical protein
MIISTSLCKVLFADLPVEEVHPHDPSLVPVDLDTTEYHTALALPKRLLLLGHRCNPKNEADEVHAKCSDDLEHLVLDIFILGEQVLGGSEAFLAHENGSRDGREDERVEKTEGEGLVLLRDDGSQESRNHREDDDAGLCSLHDLEATRRILTKDEEVHVRATVFW